MAAGRFVNEVCTSRIVHCLFRFGFLIGFDSVLCSVDPIDIDARLS